LSSKLDMERLLVEVGAVKQGDLRLQRKEEEEDKAPKSLRSSATDKKVGANEDDEDSDWD
jgi:hypothetical protein